MDDPDYEAMSARASRRMPDHIDAAIARKEAAEDYDREFRGAWKEIDQVYASIAAERKSTDPTSAAKEDSLRTYDKDRENGANVVTAWKAHLSRQEEPSTIADQRQTTLWQQTMEVGRQVRQAEGQQESSQEKEHQRRQLSL
jgi:hypothetical protein